MIYRNAPHQNRFMTIPCLSTKLSTLTFPLLYIYLLFYYQSSENMGRNEVIANPLGADRLGGHAYLGLSD